MTVRELRHRLAQCADQDAEVFVRAHDDAERDGMGKDTFVIIELLDDHAGVELQVDKWDEPNDDEVR
jgi:hypothetical protein